MEQTMGEPATSNLTDDEDEIVREVYFGLISIEIPIFNSTRLQNSLYLLRYPLISKKCPNEVTLKRGFFKPKNQEVELEMCIDVESANFDSDRAELIAQEIDGVPESRKSAAKVHFENDLVDKVTLRSSEAVKDASKYAVLTYNGKEIYLTALKNIFQLRPSFTYLDKKSKKRKDSDHNDLSDDDDGDDREAGPSTAEPITVKFKQNDDRWNKIKRHEKDPDEAWIPCEVHPEVSSLSKVEKLKLIAENTEPTGQAMNLTGFEYVRVLVPEDEGQATTEPSSPSHIMSLHTLRASPISEQCRVLLKDAQIIQFQQLLMILAGGEGVTADTVLKSLPKVAVLVRGNWVVKSEVLYPSNSLSSTSGVPAELMCRTRDYVLYLFTKNHYVERKKVSSVMKIPSEEVKEIFMGFSKLSHNKGWELVLPTDNDFIMKHSDIVQKQKDAWEEKFKQLSEFLRENQKQRRKSKSVSEDGKIRNGTNYFSSDNDSGTEKNKSPVAARKNKIAKIKDSIQQGMS